LADIEVLLRVIECEVEGHVSVVDVNIDILVVDLVQGSNQVG
jgi:hypothetical protein